MMYYIELDVSVENTAVCVIDDTGRITKEHSVPSHPDDLAAAMGALPNAIGATVLEAGPLSSFLAAGLKRHGLDPVLMETRRGHAALSAFREEGASKGTW